MTTRSHRICEFPQFFLLLVLPSLVLLAITVQPKTARAQDWAITRITTDPGRQGIPDISGDNIVYMDYAPYSWGQGADVYVYNLKTSTLTAVATGPVTNPLNRGYVLVDGDYVAYGEAISSSLPSGFDLYAYKISTKEIMKIDPSDERLASTYMYEGFTIYNGKIVWEGNKGLYLYDTSSRTDQLLIPNDSVSFKSPLVNDRWLVCTGSDGYLYTYDLLSQTGRPVRTNIQGSGALVGDKLLVTGTEYDQYGSTWIRRGLLVMDLGTGNVATLRDDLLSYGIVDSNGSRILMINNTADSRDLYLYDYSANSLEQLTANDIVNIGRIDGDRIVYEGFGQDRPNADIYLASKASLPQPPIVTISSVSSGVDVRVSGFAHSDTTPIKAVQYQVDGTDSSGWVPLSPAVVTDGFLTLSKDLRFTFTIPRLPSGSHTVHMRAVDMDDLTSEVVEAPFTQSQWIEVDRSLSEGVIDGEVITGFPHATVKVVNKHHFWTKLTITPIPPRIGVNRNDGLGFLDDLLVGQGYSLLGPGQSATYDIAFAELHDGVYFFADPTAESGDQAPILNMLDILLSALPGDAKPKTTDLRDLPDIIHDLKDIEGFSEAAQKLSQPNPDVAGAAWDIVKLVGDPRAANKLAKVLKKMGAKVSKDKLADKLTAPALIDAIWTTTDLVSLEFSGHPSGTVAFIVR